MSDFRGSNVVVTGGAAGLGLHLAEALAEAGARVMVLDRDDPAAAVAALRARGADADGLTCDISDERQVVPAIRAVAHMLDGRIDVLVNNAGFNGHAQLVRDMPLQAWNRTLGINLTGTMLVTREVIPHMIERRAGRIVNIASNVARRGLPYRADYVCSKWALLGLTQTLALELADHGIRVNAVCPGPIEGERIEQLVRMHAEAEGVDFGEMHQAWEQVPMRRFMRPSEVASVVLFLASDASSAMTGQALNVTGGFIMT
jgi:NAD(P)-dependent dehydrogenase (short-subunit alcohol dehydrogenase family)